MSTQEVEFEQPCEKVGKVWKPTKAYLEYVQRKINKNEPYLSPSEWNNCFIRN